MENEYYNVNDVDKDNIHDFRRNKDSWKPFSRQLSIVMGMWTLYFLKGIMIGTPTVMIPQLRREMNSTLKFNEDFAPWLSSVFGIGGTPWVFILPVLLDVLGRKYTFIVISSVTSLGYIVFYCSNTVVQILISEIILGILITATHTVLTVTLTEYVTPQYRGLFSTFKSASYLWGIWVANAIGTFSHWKNIGILALVCCSYTLTGFKWPESPYWLASKGNFDECAAAHRWLKGTDFNSEQELRKLLESQTYELSNVATNKSFKTLFIKFRRMLKLPEFYKPIVLCVLLLLLYYVSGKLVCVMYAIEIVKRITHDNDAAYKTMLILDGFSVISAYIGSISSKYLKRKTLLISTASVATLFLYIIALYLYLIKLSLLIENDVISISFLTLYSMAVSSGTIILMSCIMGELLPIRFRSWSILIVAIFVNLFHFTTLRITPEVFKLFGLHGAFFFYGIGSTVSLYLIYIFMPETKDKTLQEIEECFKVKLDSDLHNVNKANTNICPLIEMPMKEINSIK